MHVGILGYGVYIPRFRIKTCDIASVWGKSGSEMERALGIAEKSVPGLDEDTVTLAYEAAVSALARTGISPTDIQLCFVGSESHPYAVNPTSTIVAEFLGFGNAYLASDLEFACKAATTGLIAAAGLVEAGEISTGLIIGSDTAQAKPHDILEYTAGSAAVALIVGKSSQGAIANILASVSYSSDTPDFWRRDGIRFPSHGGRFTGEPSYFTHITGAVKLLLKKTQLAPSDFSYCVFHMPNGKFPREIAKRFGFASEQIAPSLIVEKIGNPYTASSLCGLAATLDIAQAGDKILFVSYGSGAGSDGFVLEVTEHNEKQSKNRVTVTKQLEDKKYISYVQYLKQTGKM